jgi:hypothetical protein
VSKVVELARSIPRHSQNYLDKKPFEGDSREVAKKGVPPILRV